MLPRYFQWPQPRELLVPLAEPLLGSAESKALSDCFNSGWIGSASPVVSNTEALFNKFFSAHSLLVANGSVAIMLALRSLGIKAGDEVLVPALTYAATASSVINVGARPVFCDVEVLSWQIDPDSIERMISPYSKAIIVPHLYGVPADLDKIILIAQKYGLHVIEDVAESFGGSYKGKLLGTIGEVGTFSFFPNKLITSGEGGLCLTRDESLLSQMALLRGQGMDSNQRYVFLEPGYNFRMTGLQASILKVQLERYAELKMARSISETTYSELLSEQVSIPKVEYEHSRAPWIFSCLLRNYTVRRKKLLAEKLADLGVETRPVFYPLPTMPAFSDYKSDDYENADRISNHGISFPTGLHVQPSTYETILREVIANA